MMPGESSHVRSGSLAMSASEMLGISGVASGQVDWVRMEAASERAWEASELLQASEGALVLLSRVVAEKVDARAAAVSRWSFNFGMM